MGVIPEAQDCIAWPTYWQAWLQSQELKALSAYNILHSFVPSLFNPLPFPKLSESIPLQKVP